MKRNKIVFIGGGFVGPAFVHAVADKGPVDELAIIDIDEDKARTDIWDLSHATPFGDKFVDVHLGSHSGCNDADIVVICASTKLDRGDTRLKLLGDNINIFVLMIRKVIAHGFDGYFVLLFSPVDIMSYVIKCVPQFPKNKIIGSGTSLDTVRFEFFSSRMFDVAPQNIYVPIIGEHGDSQAAVWSHTQIAGEPVLDLLNKGVDQIVLKQSIAPQTTQAGYDIYVRKGTTNFGIPLSLARIVEAILFNKDVIMNVSSYFKGEYELNDLYVGTPTVINGNGADHIIELKLEEDELTRFRQSSHIILEHQQRVDAIIESILNK